MSATQSSALSDQQAQAAQALVDDAGCLPGRANELVGAVGEVAVEEALSIVAGKATVSASVVDTRLSRLKQIIEHLPETAPFPNPYEVGVIFRITTSQARTLINTYQARYSADYRAHMERLVQVAEAKASTRGGREVWVIDFGDPAALDYAYEMLRRRGLSKTLERDRTAMTLVVDRSQKDRNNRDAVQALGCRVK